MKKNNIQIHNIYDFNNPVDKQSLLKLKQVINDTYIQVDALLSINNIHILLISNKYDQIIEELGVGGYCNDSSIISIYFDTKQEIKKILNNIGPIFVHELNHSKRINTVGYGDTLYEAILLEGIACYFEQIMFPENIIPYIISNESEIRNIINMLPKNNQKNYNHSDWFFGTNDNIPKWAGYKLGYYLVKNYLKKTGISIQDITIKQFTELEKEIF